MTRSWIPIALVCTLTWPSISAAQNVPAGVDMLLRVLSQRLDQVDQAQKENRLLTFPTEKVDSLLGLSRAAIRAALGHKPIDCRLQASRASASDGRQLRIAPCEADNDLAYSFYALPRNSVGGGPELLLQFDGQGRCRRAIWEFTQ